MPKLEAAQSVQPSPETFHSATQRYLAMAAESAFATIASMRCEAAKDVPSEGDVTPNNEELATRLRGEADRLDQDSTILWPVKEDAQVKRELRATQAALDGLLATFKPALPQLGVDVSSLGSMSGHADASDEYGPLLKAKIEEAVTSPHSGAED